MVLATKPNLSKGGKKCINLLFLKKSFKNIKNL